MINKVLVIAPHPDDEINLAGQLIVKLNQFGVEIFVAYTTNGDAEPKIGNKRIQEAINANSILGIKEDHVIFLGYPNEWSGAKHIYNAPENEELISKLGKTKTNSIPTHPEFCYEKKSLHHTFTRKNFKDDFSELIEDIKPDLLIAPEFDSHPDHRATSLFFDEVMGELLKKDKNYRPIIFKKYIHEGVWYGPKDYYCEPMVPTLTEGPRNYSGGIHDLDSPSFRWDERLSFDVDNRTKTPLLRDNVIYKAAKKHKVTTAWYEMQRVINADVVYWQRYTNNRALDSIITVSSGNAKLINDFKRYDCDDVLGVTDIFGKSEQYCWRPQSDDMDKIITIDLGTQCEIDKVVIFEDCNYNNHIKKMVILDEDKIIDVIELENSGQKKEVNFKGYLIQKISFKIIEWTGTPGISEIEIYSCDNDEKYLYKEDINCSFKQRKIIWVYIEKMYFLLKFLFTFKLHYEISKKFHSAIEKNRE